MSMRKHKARQFPNGKVHDHDEGSVQMRIAADPKRQVVVIEFANTVKWFALSKQTALGLAALIIKNANSLPDVPEVNSPPAEDVQ